MNEHAFKKKTSLDKDLKKIVRLEKATLESSRQFVKIGLSVLFLIAVWIFASMQTGAINNSDYVIAAGIIGGYMALNIGANDVANAMGTSVGSGALTFRKAIILATFNHNAAARSADSIPMPNLISPIEIFFTGSWSPASAGADVTVGVVCSTGAVSVAD